MKISELKKEAKVKLSGKLGKTIVINLIYLVLTALLTYVSTYITENVTGIVGGILSLIIAVISLPLSYGLLTSMIKLSRNEEVSFIEFLPVGLKNLGKILKLYISMIVRLLLPLLLIILAVLLGLAENFLANLGSSFVVILSISSVIGTIAAYIFFIYKTLSYTLSTYLLYDNPEANSKEIISKSAELMKGHKWKLIGLEFSFIGWYLLIGLVSGLTASFSPVIAPIVLYAGVLLLTPYISFTSINFYEDLAGISNNVSAVETTNE